LYDWLGSHTHEGMDGVENKEARGISIKQRGNGVGSTKQWCGFLLIGARQDLARLAKIASVMLRSSSHTHPLTHMHATHHMDQADRADGMSSIHASGGRAFLYSSSPPGRCHDLAAAA
jgi:hypothetical protein